MILPRAAQGQAEIAAMPRENPERIGAYGCIVNMRPLCCKLSHAQCWQTGEIKKRNKGCNQKLMLHEKRGVVT